MNTGELIDLLEAHGRETETIFITHEGKGKRYPQFEYEDGFIKVILR